MNSGKPPNRATPAAIVTPKTGVAIAPPAAQVPGGDLFFRQVVEGMRCGLVTVDARGTVLTINELAREILELDPAESMGRDVRVVLARHPRLAEVLLDALEMRHLPNRAEMEIRSKQDDGRTIGFTISQIKDREAIAGVAMFFKDLTMVERQEEQDRLRDRLVALGQMAASMAHEIRNPLASIDVTAALLRRKLAGRDEELRLINKIVDEVQRLNRTVTRGLEYARGVFPELVEQPLPPLVEQALEEAQAHAASGDVAIVRRYDPATPNLACDGALMRQVFVNLIANAFEAMEGSGTLTLELRPAARHERTDGANDTIEIVVRDSGPGLNAEIQDKIFYPFVTTKKGGSGIGLAMARKIVECHHGMIDVESERGTGTAFRIVLPRGMAAR